MERQFQCPSCGGGNIITNPGVLMSVCPHCRTATYWDKDSALRVGRKSMELLPSSRFRVGGTAKLKGRSFRVLGRLSYGYEKGTWEEWFIEMQDGNILWLTEDEGELFLETPLSLTSPVPPYSELSPGMQINLNDKMGTIEELGEARCLGGEGEIPFQVEIGETYPYADGSVPDETSSFGLEYDARTGNVRAFIGRILDVKDSRVRPEDRGAPVTRTTQAIRCPSCGKPYEGPRLESTKTVVCDACGSGLALDEAEMQILGKNVGKEPGFTFKIGMPLTLEGTRYEVMGRLSYSETEGKNEYISWEYVLYNPDAGYLWLSEEDGHFTLSRVGHVSVAIPPIPVAKMKVSVGQETFRVYESGTSTVRWVDGAIPWRAAVGEKTRYTHLIKPPEYLDREITGSEVEIFRGRYVSHEEIEEATGNTVKLPRMTGVYSCQPYTASAWITGIGPIAGGFLLINCLLLLWVLQINRRPPILQGRISAEQYSKEHLTSPFDVPRDGSILRLSGSAPVDNSWLALDFGLVDADERVVSQFGNEASYYHGQDSEGSWSEGSRSFSSYFKVNKAGAYRLLLHGQGGSGEGGGSRNEPVDIAIFAGMAVPWYFIIPIIVSGLVMIVGPIHRGSFEARRWSAVASNRQETDD
ncbi:MAG: DUF4178 domain-containing protein [Desulfomonilaceae bacterium]